MFSKQSLTGPSARDCFLITGRLKGNNGCNVYSSKLFLCFLGKITKLIGYLTINRTLVYTHGTEVS